MTKKLLLCLFSMVGTLLAIGQQSPVSWSFNAKKTGDKAYELHITALIAEPWNIYSQNTPQGGPLPTRIAFVHNPLVTKTGNVKELGALQRKHEEVFDVDVLYYKTKVEFVQTIKVKKQVRTNITGSVEFMACNNEQCLPPKTISFNKQLD